MTLFFGIFISLIVINALLLVFSTSLRSSKAVRGRPGNTPLTDSGVVSFKVRKSDLQKAG